MAIDVKIVAQRRNKTGTGESRRLRRQGRVPGNLYGHGGDSVSISVSAVELMPIVSAGNRVLEMEIDGKTELTMFREVQWDTFGTYIQHIDLLRVDADQRVEVEVPVTLRGIAPGTLSGGIVEQSMRSLSVECAAFAIPDSLTVRIGHLEIGDVVKVEDVELPDDTTVRNPPDSVVVQVIMPMEDIEEEEAVPGPVEPEVIGRPSEEADEGS